MSIEELLQQMEHYRARREQRDGRPEWLKTFIKNVAELFEPLNNIGRVGFDCQGHERGWTVCVYLGTTEIIGGPKDGQIEHASFVVDVVRMTKLFHKIDRFEWYSISNDNDNRFEEATRSLLSVHGAADAENQVHLELLHAPPRFVGPGLQKKDDTQELS